jgi:hypothetical protein
MCPSARVPPATAHVRAAPASATSRILRTMTRWKLLRVVEIAEILGASKQRADQLRREPNFPAPVDRWARGDLWAPADVRRWARTYAGGAARWGERWDASGRPGRCSCTCHMLSDFERAARIGIEGS